MKLKRLSLFFVLLVMFFILPVYANDENVNIDEFDDQLAEKLQIPLFAAQMLASGLFLAWFVFPPLLMAKEHVTQSYVVLIFGLTTMGFCIAMGWLPVWLMVLTVLFITFLISQKIPSLFGGGS